MQAPPPAKRPRLDTSSSNSQTTLLSNKQQSTAQASAFAECLICHKKVPASTLNFHLDEHDLLSRTSTRGAAKPDTISPAVPAPSPASGSNATVNNTLRSTSAGTSSSHNGVSALPSAKSAAAVQAARDVKPAAQPPPDTAPQPKKKSAFDALMQPGRIFNASKAAAQTDVYAAAQVVFTVDEQQAEAQQQAGGVQGPSPSPLPAAVHNPIPDPQQTSSECPEQPPALLPELFSASLPPGLTVLLNPQVQGDVLVKGFLTEEEEAALLAMCDEGAVWHDSRFNGSYRGQYWGLVTDLQARTVHPERVPLPSQLHKLAERMHALGRQLATRRDTAELATRMTAFQPNEANALEYTKERGSVLTPHADNRQLSGDIICTLSLVGRAVMTLKWDTKYKKGAEHVVRLELPPRSLHILHSKARYDYTHEIKHADLLDPRRVSITMRHCQITNHNPAPAGTVSYAGGAVQKRR